jgi:hypothetical protein
VIAGPGGPVGGAVTDAPPQRPVDPDDFLKALEVATGIRPPPERQDLPKGEHEQKVVALVRKLEKEAEGESGYWRAIRRMRYNEEYYLGNFDVEWDKNAKRLETVEDKAPDGHKVHVNMFRPTADIRVAKLQTIQPQFVVEPNGVDQDTVEASRTTQRYLSEHCYRVQEMDLKKLRFLFALNLYGEACWKVWWDPRGGRYLGKKTVPLRDKSGALVPALAVDPDPASPTFGTPVPVRDEFGKPTWATEKELDTDEKSPTFGQEIEVQVDTWEGAPRTDNVHPEDLLSGGPDEDTDDTTHRWWMIRSTTTPAAIFDETEIAVQPDSQGDRAGASASGGMGSRSADWLKSRRSLVVQREVFIPGGTWPYGDKKGEVVEFPHGVRIVEAGRRILAFGKNEYEHGRPPIVYERVMPLEKHARGTTRMDDVRGLQATFLASADIAVGILTLMGNPQWIVHADAEVPDTDWDNVPGTVKRHNARMDWQMPRVVEGAQPPHGWFMWMDRVKESLLPYVAGVNPGGLAGGVVPNVEAAAAFMEMVKRDLDQLTPEAAAIKRAFEKWMYLQASMAQQFVTEERLVTTSTGRSASSEVFAFSGADVRDSFAYVVTDESAKPRNEAVVFQETLMLLDKGLISPLDAMRRIGHRPGVSPSLDEKMALRARQDVLEARRFKAVQSDPRLLMLANPAVYLNEYLMFVYDPSASDDPEAFEAIITRAMMLKQQMTMAAMAQAPGPDAPQGAPPPSGPSPGPTPGPGNPTASESESAPQGVAA